MGAIYANVLKPYTPKKRYIPKNKKTEESVQKLICRYVRNNLQHVIFMSDYAAGIRLTQHQAMTRKSMQSESKLPDLFFAHPATITDGNGIEHHYCGLFLEVKKEGTSIYVTRGPRKGELVADPHIRGQAAVMKRLNKDGYFARFSVGYDQAVKIINWYFGIPENGQLF